MRFRRWGGAADATAAAAAAVSAVAVTVVVAAAAVLRNGLFVHVRTRLRSCWGGGASGPSCSRQTFFASMILRIGPASEGEGLWFGSRRTGRGPGRWKYKKESITGSCLIFYLALAGG